MRILSFFCVGLLALPVQADPAVIEAVSATKSSGGWTFSVTVRHAETGWDDYANGWRVKLPDGTVLGTRELAHPHQDEQPFTRSLGGIRIPDDTDVVIVESSTLVEGWSGTPVTFTIPK